MSYSLKDLCDEIGLLGEERNLRFIYEHSDGPASLDPNHPLPPLEMWCKVRPGRTTDNPRMFKGVIPTLISNIPVEYNEPWTRNFSEDSEHLHHFYDTATNTPYNHLEGPPLTGFDSYVINYGAPVYPETYEVYNDDEDAGGATYPHQIKCEIIGLNSGPSNSKVLIKDVIGTGGKFGVYAKASGSATHDFSILNPNTLENSGEELIIDIKDTHWPKGNYTLYPYLVSANGVSYSYPFGLGDVNTFIVLDVADIPYIPMTGVRWEYDWIDLAYISGSPQQGTVHAYTEAASSNVPTHGLIGFIPLDSSVVDVVSPSGEVETVDTVVTLQSNSAGVAYVRAIGHDKKAGSPTFQDLLKVYTGGRDLVLSPISMDLRISATGNETTANVIAKAAPDSSINTYTWTAADSTVLTIISTQSFQDSNDGNWHKSRCTIKGIKPNVPGSPTNLNCAAVEMNRNCAVSVYNPAVGVTITQQGTQANPIELEEGDTLQLNANLQGLNTNYSVSDSTLVWWSSTTFVATVSAGGLVTGVAANNSPVDITATTNNSKWNDWTTYTAHCYIKVVTPAPPYIPVTSISIYPTTMKFTSISGSDTATVTVNPSTATNKEIIWNPSSSGIISITPDSQDSRIATIAPVSRGLVDAIAVSQDGGYTARCSVQVGDDISSVTLNKHSTTITVGGTDTLTATLLPSTAFNTNVFWTTDNSAIATVNGGVISGVAAGTTTIWAKASGDNSIKDSCTVVVSSSTYATAVYPDPDNATISSGTTGNIFTPSGFDVYPVGSTYDSAVYSIASGSSHLQLLNADTGRVKGLSAGDAVLRLTLTCGSNTVIGDINITIT